MTELQKLKQKKKANKATPEDLTRLKQLQDGEPLSKADLANAEKREADRKVADKKAFDDKQNTASGAEALPACFGRFSSPGAADCATVCQHTEDCKKQPKSEKAETFNSSLDTPAEHPRIAEIKQALMPFTQIEAHASRPDEFVLITRGISITAGDVRRARQAMKI